MSQVQTEVIEESEAQPDLIVSEKLIDAIVRSEEKFCLEIRKCDPQEAILNLVNGYKGAFYYIQPYLSSYSQPKILEIGSGNGFGLCYLLKSGLDVTGVEPGDEFSFEGRFQRAIDLLELNGIRSATSRLLPAHAEKLPFEDNTFDIVFSAAVLEHVKDIELSMREALRVVKPNGVVVMNVPNYNSFHEHHYNILWLPYLLARKRVAKWYVRTIFRRPDYYIDELNFTTPGDFKKLAKTLPECSDMRIYHVCGTPFDKLSSRYFAHGITLIFGSDSKYKNLMSYEALTLRKTRKFHGRVRYGFHLLRRMLPFFLMGSALNLLSHVGLSPGFNVVCKKPSVDLTSPE